MTPDGWTALATVVIAAFTIILAAVGGVQAWFTNRAINLARDEFSATHRPKIIIHAVELATDSATDEEADDTLGASIIYVNIGDTPAYLTSISAKISRYDLPLPSGLGIGIGVELAKLPLPATRKIMPGVPEYLAVSSGPTLQEARFGERHAHDRGRASGVVLIGKISYYDGRGVSRQTGFCRRIDFGSAPFTIITPRWVLLEGHPEYEYSY